MPGLFKDKIGNGLIPMLLIDRKRMEDMYKGMKNTMRTSTKVMLKEQTVALGVDC